MGPMERRVAAIFLAVAGLGGGIAIVMASGSSKEAAPKDEGCECCAPIKTPSGHPGIYCSNLNSSFDGRKHAYQYISKHCSSGYDFVRENPDAVMVECKPEMGE